MTPEMIGEGVKSTLAAAVVAAAAATLVNVIGGIGGLGGIEGLGGVGLGLGAEDAAGLGAGVDAEVVERVAGVTGIGAVLDAITKLLKERLR